MYGWLMAVYVSNLIIWMVCYYYMRQMAPSASYKPTLRLLAGVLRAKHSFFSSHHNSFIIPFVGYSVTFWIVWTFAILRRSWEAWGPDDEHVLNILKLGHAITVPLQGYAL